jgi:hypothetical protein
MSSMTSISTNQTPGTPTALGSPMNAPSTSVLNKISSSSSLNQLNATTAQYVGFMNNQIPVKDLLHKLHLTSYLTPTYCEYCSQLLMGLIKQGVKCECNLKSYFHIISFIKFI